MGRERETKVHLISFFCYTGQDRTGHKNTLFFVVDINKLRESQYTERVGVLRMQAHW